MKNKLDRRGLAKCPVYSGRTRSDPLYPEKSFENPGDFISEGPAYAGKNFEQYAKSIDSFPDNYFDIVIVDGRARPSCIQQGIPKLKKNGWLIIDNTERKYYTAPFPLTETHGKSRNSQGPYLT